jgi:hypothetical protein
MFDNIFYFLLVFCFRQQKNKKIKNMDSQAQEKELRRLPPPPPQMAPPLQMAPPRIPLMSFQSPQLRKTAPREKFVNFNLQSLDHYFISIPMRMRALNFLRFYEILPEESVELNLPKSKKIDMFSIKELFYLCGGYVGIRFADDDFKLLDIITKELKIYWTNMEEIYNFPAGSSQLKEYSTMECFRNNDKNFILSITKLQDFVKIKQLLIIKKSKEQIEQEELKKENRKLLKVEEENILMQKKPKWLNCLSLKYTQSIAEILERVDGYSLKFSNMDKFTIGKFSVFLSFCVLYKVVLNLEQNEALIEVFNLF